MMRLLPILLAGLLITGCNREIREMPDPSATYESYGATTSPEGAVPLRAVSADLDTYNGQEVKIEGVISEVCTMNGCWLAMPSGDGALLRVDVPRDSTGAYVYTFPTDISGRRAIVSGRLTLPNEPESEGHNAQETEIMSQTDLNLVATGALVERVRS